MTWWKIMIVFVVMIAVSLSHEPELLERPARPAEFRSNSELQKFLKDIKAYAVMNSSRYGKRFSPPVIGKIRPEMFYAKNANKQDLHDLYEFFKQYSRE